jgi:hypothetical protein
MRITSATVAALVAWLLVLPIAASAAEPPKGFRSVSATTIHETKMGVKLGDTFGVMQSLIYPLDLSQNSTAILHADSLAACPDRFKDNKTLPTLSIKQS